MKQETRYREYKHLSEAIKQNLKDITVDNIKKTWVTIKGNLGKTIMINNILPEKFIVNRKSPNSQITESFQKKHKFTV